MLLRLDSGDGFYRGGSGFDLSVETASRTADPFFVVGLSGVSVVEKGLCSPRAMFPTGRLFTELRIFSILEVSA